MQLTDEQFAALDKAAQDEGVDPGELRAAAESLDNGAPGSRSGIPNSPAAHPQQQGKLFMYLLPFVSVREVRQAFLGLTEPFDGDNEIASDWATAHPLIGAKDVAQGE